MTRAKTPWEQRRDAAFRADMAAHFRRLNAARERETVPMGWAHLPEAAAPAVRDAMFTFLEVFGEPITFTLQRRIRRES